MQKILSFDDPTKIAENLHSQDKKIVLVGGCFDILHQGHIKFLEAAKKQGDILIVLVESDTSVRKKKGPGRPVNSQAVRASILAALPSVDYVLVLPLLKTDQEYDAVVLQLKPAIIATTKGDPGRTHLERQAKRIGGATVIDVIDRLPEYASSSLAEKL